MDVFPRRDEVVGAVAVLGTPWITVRIVHLVCKTDEDRFLDGGGSLRPRNDVEVVIAARDRSQTRVFALRERREIGAQALVEVDDPRLPRDERNGSHALDRLDHARRKLLVGLIAPR